MAVLPAPIALDTLSLAPGERAEVLVDMSGGGVPVLMSDPAQPYGVLHFAVDAALPARITRLPDELDGVLEDLAGAEVETREVSLDMGMGGMMMGAVALPSTDAPMTWRGSTSRSRRALSSAGTSAARWSPIRSTFTVCGFVS